MVKDSHGYIIHEPRYILIILVNMLTKRKQHSKLRTLKNEVL